MFKKEVERLVQLWVLEVANCSEWGAPSFAQPKPKSNQVRFLSDFININKQLKQKPYDIPKINDMLLKLKGFQYAKSLDLNMGYYHIRLSKNVSNLCKIILPWGKNCYKRLPMRFANLLDISQYKTNDLFHGFEFICAYINGILILKKGDWTDHVQKLESTLIKLKVKGLKYNIEESFFGQTKLE